MGAWYTTRERAMRAADVKGVAYASSEIDEAIESASRDVDRLIRRGDATRPGLAPWYGTRAFDWPTAENTRDWCFRLGRFTLIEANAVVSGGVDITADVILDPVEAGHPYTKLSVDRDTGSVLSYTSGVGQRSLSVTGLWGWTNAERSTATWLLGSSPNATTTSVTINAPIGVGDIVRVDSERMIVIDRTWTSSGQTGTLTSSTSAQALSVSDGTAFFVGETLLIESERVLVQDISGNTLVVKRAVDGTTLAAHTAASISYSRSCTVERGALGTTADSHTSGTRVYAWWVPPVAQQLTLAYVLDRREQERSAYARTIGSGENERTIGRGGIPALEARAEEIFGRPVRTAAV